jgi:hypothetical protein
MARKSPKQNVAGSSGPARSLADAQREQVALERDRIALEKDRMSLPPGAFPPPQRVTSYYLPTYYDSPFVNDRTTRAGMTEKQIPNLEWGNRNGYKWDGKGWVGIDAPPEKPSSPFGRTPANPEDSIRSLIAANRATPQGGM